MKSLKKTLEESCKKKQHRIRLTKTELETFKTSDLIVSEFWKDLYSDS